MTAHEPFSKYPENGGRTVALDLVLGHIDVLAQAQSCARPPEQSRPQPAPQPAPQPEPDIVATDSSRDADQNDRPESQRLALVGDEAREHEHGFAGNGHSRIFSQQSRGQSEISPSLESKPDHVG